MIWSQGRRSCRKTAHARAVAQEKLGMVAIFE